MVSLQGGDGNVTFMLRGNLPGGRAGAQAAHAAVVADAIRREMVRHGTVINVGEARPTKIVHGAVIEESPTPPVPPDITQAVVAKAIVDASVETHVQTPIACMPDEGCSAPAPITRRPQETHCGRHRPNARNPVVAVNRIICPVTWSPDVPGSRANWLRINGKLRRRDPNRYAHAN